MFTHAIRDSFLIIAGMVGLSAFFQLVLHPEHGRLPRTLRTVIVPLGFVVLFCHAVGIPGSLPALLPCLFGVWLLLVLHEGEFRFGLVGALTRLKLSKARSPSHFWVCWTVAAVMLTWLCGLLVR